MKNSHKKTFIAHDQPLKMKDVLPMFRYLGLSENEIALFLGMRPESPYAEKYIANVDQELNHLQLYASRSMDLVISLGIEKMLRDQFSSWIQSPQEVLGNQAPKNLLLDVNAHESLKEVLTALK